MNKYVKSLVEAIMCGTVYFLVTLFLNRDNIVWSEIIIPSVIFMGIYFVVSIVDNIINSKKNK